MNTLVMEAIGWSSTAIFLVSILVKERIFLHQLGILASLTTGIYAYHHGATAIWVKWLIALFFHAYMWWKLAGLSPKKRLEADRTGV
ncbi:MAG: hypothetical protein JNL01_12495 [Bdellovibrionales bacterium]|nr:hypothetical protein [Bdellovibrionales bacterium]